MSAAARQRRREERLRKSEADVGLNPNAFAMTSLFPESTGLPMTIWVGPRRRARIKVSMTPGERTTIGAAAVVRPRPRPQVVAGRLEADDREAVFQWIALNERPLLDHWHGLLDSGELIERLVPLPARRLT
jgi:hypothetical protein